MSEVRLMAMRFVPSDEGGFFWPAHAEVSPDGERMGWVDAWDAGITEEEAVRIFDHEPGEPEAREAYWKLRAAFASTPGCPSNKPEEES